MKNEIKTLQKNIREIIHKQDQQNATESNEENYQSD
jgi:hypothetical protein